MKLNEASKIKKHSHAEVLLCLFFSAFLFFGGLAAATLVWLGVWSPPSWLVSLAAFYAVASVGLTDGCKYIKRVERDRAALQDSGR